MVNTRNKLGQFVKGHPNLSKKKGKYFKCYECEKIIYRPICEIKTKNFCSIKCRSKNASKEYGMGNSWHWKGGRRLAASGYIMIFKPDHPHNCYKYVREHRLVMEKKLKRYLRTDEIVHHINGIKTDNRIENLQITTRAEHNTIHKHRKNT